MPQKRGRSLDRYDTEGATMLTNQESEMLGIMFSDECLPKAGYPIQLVTTVKKLR